MITFLSDVFHPLVTPVTTYTHTTRDLGVDTVSSADEDRLPPGGFALRHGFPEWFEGVTVRAPKMHPKSVVSSGPDVPSKGLSANGTGADSAALGKRLPHIVEVLQYLRVAFDTESVLDSIPLDVAVNSGACHAWRSYRSKVRHSRMSPPPHGSRDTSEAGSDRSTSPRQQPGGARRPGEWNWQGVWEDRVRKSIQASNSEAVLFGGGDGNDVVSTPTVLPDGLLTDDSDQLFEDGRRYARATSTCTSDASCACSRFTVNAVNQRPTAPLQANPKLSHLRLLAAIHTSPSRLVLSFDLKVRWQQLHIAASAFADASFLPAMTSQGVTLELIAIARWHCGIAT